MAQNMPSLFKVAMLGASWTAASRIVVTVIQFFQLAILAHFLPPGDFGLMAMVGIVLSIAAAFGDLGISNAIIFRQDATAAELSSLYWANIFAGILLFSVVMILRPLIARFFSETSLAYLIPYSALVFLITPFGTQFRVLLQRELTFKALALVDAACTALGALSTVVLAIKGAGVMSLVLGQLVVSGTSTLALASIGWRRWPPTYGFAHIHLRKYVGFGLFQVGERLINQITSQADQLIIGALLGSHILGLYSVAWNLVVQPVTKINPVLTTVAFPIFAKLQNDDLRLREAYVSLLSILCTLNAPLLLGLAAVAPLFVPLVYGDKWVPIIGLVQILSFVGLGMTIGNPVGSLLLSRGRADLGFKWNLMLLAVQIPAIIAGAFLNGVIGIAFSLLALQAIFPFPLYWFLVRPLIGPCAREYIRATVPACGIAFAMASVITLSIAVVHVLPSWPSLIGSIGLGATVYGWMTFRLRGTAFLTARRPY